LYHNSKNNSFKSELEIFTLNKHLRSKEIRFASNNDDLLINTISLIQDKANDNWQLLISKLEVKVNIKITLLDSLNKEYTYSVNYPIHLFFDPYDVNPVFEVNKLVNIEALPVEYIIGKILSVTIKIELLERENINEEYYLQFQINHIPKYS